MSRAFAVTVVQDFSNGCGLGDESEDFHLASALLTSQRVDFKDTVDELGPSFVRSASRRRVVVGIRGALLGEVGGANTIGVGAI